MQHDLLLLSSTAVFGMQPLEFALDEVKAFLDGESTLLFVPYAKANYDDYTLGVQSILAPLGITVVGIHTASDPRQVVETARVLFVGGGNSFRLLKALQEHGLLATVRARVEAGEMRYMGSSAGTNMACPSLRTTNDMPIVRPISFETFGLIPFQINPHYLDPDPHSPHQGETRAERIEEFLEENDVPVLGMREGCWLRRRASTLTLGGVTGARLFIRSAEPREITPGT
ncbi:MAG TPA: dipeptidase PepE, partial [Ktedonobacterales bacterium]|nr:dipeptidase PepE [Ktedonobacterales bacterium]